MVRQDDTTHARTHLSDLVRDRRAELRLSLRVVEERTVDPESGEPAVKRGWLDKLEKVQPVIPPQFSQLQALARALGMPLSKLQEAAGAQFFGIDTVWSASGEARALVAHAERLTPNQREQLTRLLESFANDSEA